VNKIVSHQFEGPYQACMVDGCELRRESPVHAANRVAEHLGARSIFRGLGTREGAIAVVVGHHGEVAHTLEAADVRDALDRLHKAETALEAVLGVQDQTGAGDYNRALADVRQAIIEALV
jgi:ABC-type sugar transport system substrate-binding protein